MSIDCPICGAGILCEKVEINDSTNLQTRYSVCDTCGSEQADSIQLEANKLNMIKLVEVE